MMFFDLRQGILIAACLSLVACDSGSSGSQASVSEMPNTAEFQTGTALNKVSFMEATPEQLSEHVVACKGGGNSHAARVCVAICHRPPGNPEKGRNMILSLSAVSAHLRHGKAPDFLGACEGSAVDEGDAGAVVADDDSGADADEGGDPAGDDAAGELPNWCEVNLEFDADCDGVNDSSGTPMY